MRLIPRIGVLTVVASLGLGGCHKPLDTTKQTDTYSSFGEIMYRESCQRVAYTGELADKAAGKRETVDVSGALAQRVCRDGEAPPTDATQKLKAIVPQRDVIISTVNLIMPKPILSDVSDFLTALLPLHDDGTMEATITSVAQLLGEMRDDVDLSPALERIAARKGYRPLKHSPGLTPILLNYTYVDDLLGKLLGLITDDGAGVAEWKALLAVGSLELRASKFVDDPSDPERTLKLALDLLLSGRDALGTGKARWAVRRDFRGVAVVRPLSDGSLPEPFVDSDDDGLADIDAQGRFVDAGGAPVAAPSPFPAPGESDSAERDDSGRALVPGSNATIYEYVDLDRTVLSALMRDSKTLLDPDKNSLLGLLWGASALLGPRETATKSYESASGKDLGTLSYNGHNTAQASLLDLTHSFTQLLGDPNIQNTLRATKTLLVNHESAATRAVKAMFDTNDLGKKYPGAQLKPGSTLFDDLAPIIVRTLRVPGLAEDLVAALQNPHVRGLAPMIARQMQAKNQVDFDHSDNFNWSFDSGSLDLVEEVDRTKPDIDYNRSLFQRIAHLIWEVNDTEFCNKQDAELVGFKIGPLTFNITRDRCKLFRVPDLGLFFILLMASPEVIEASKSDPVRIETTFKKASFCEQITDSTMYNVLAGGGALADATLPIVVGIKDFKCIPTPVAATRSLFLEPEEQSAFMQNTTDPVPGKSGDPLVSYYSKSIFAWETHLNSNPAGAINSAYYNDTFYDAIRPLVDAYAKHDECMVSLPESGVCPPDQRRNAAKILVDLLAMMHTHWPSPVSTFSGKTYQADITKPNYANLDSAMTYEPMLIEIFGKSDLVPSVIDLAPILSKLTVDGTPAGAPALASIAQSARYVFDWDIQPTALAARDGKTTTFKADGKTPGPRATTYSLMADAFAKKKQQLGQAEAAQGAAWSSATTTLVDLMLTVEKTADGYQMQNRRVFAMTPIIVDFLIDRVAAHKAGGDLSTWAHKQLSTDLADAIGGPTFTALADLADKINADVPLRDALYALLNYLFEDTGASPPFDVQLATIGDLLQTMLDDGNLVPVGRAVGSALDPMKGAADKQLTFMKKARERDPKKVLLALLRNLYKVDDRTLYPASDLADVIAEMNRTTPGQGGRMDAGDYQTMLSEVHDFLADEKRGFMRFLKVVQNRNLPTAKQ